MSKQFYEEELEGQRRALALVRTTIADQEALAKRLLQNIHVCKRQLYRIEQKND